MNIRKSMLINNALIIIIPFILLSFTLLQTYNVQMNYVIEESLQSVAKAQNALLREFCQEQMNTMQQVGDADVTRAALRGDLNDEVLRYLEDLLATSVNRTASVENMTIINTNYQVIASSVTEAAEDAKQGITGLIHDLGDEPFYISNVCHYDVNGQERKVVVALMKIRDENYGVIGYMLAEINLEFYGNLREQADLWNDATFYLLDGNDDIISAGTSHEQRDEFITSEEEREDYQKQYSAVDQAVNPSGSFTYQIGGEDYVTYYSNVEYTNWELLISINMDDYSAHHEVYNMVILFVLALCAVVAVWLGRFTSRRIVRPITRISDTLKQIREEKDYSLRVSVLREDEIGIMGKEINRLLRFLQVENFQRIQQQKLLQQRADQDALTKVLNKERINEYMEDALNKHKKDKTKVAVLFLDIDDFKDFNTRYGHSVGDQVLLFVASLLEREIKGTVGRAGGDEFVAIIEEPEILANLQTCLTHMEQRAETDFVLRNVSEHVAISFCIGVALVDFAQEHGDEITVKDWVDLADAAMYEVKDGGKHGFLIKQVKMTTPPLL